MLGVLLPLGMARGTGPTYAALFWPGEDAVLRLTQSGGGWRLLRVVSKRPVPVLLVTQTGPGGQRLRAWLLPVSAFAACRFADTGQ